MNWTEDQFKASPNAVTSDSCSISMKEDVTIQKLIGLRMSSTVGNYKKSVRDYYGVEKTLQREQKI